MSLEGIRYREDRNLKEHLRIADDPQCHSGLRIIVVFGKPRGKRLFRHTSSDIIGAINNAGNISADYGTDIDRDTDDYVIKKTPIHAVRSLTK